MASGRMCRRWDAICALSCAVLVAADACPVRTARSHRERPCRRRAWARVAVETADVAAAVMADTAKSSVAGGGSSVG